MRCWYFYTMYNLVYSTILSFHIRSSAPSLTDNLQSNFPLQSPNRRAEVPPLFVSYLVGHFPSFVPLNISCSSHSPHSSHSLCSWCSSATLSPHPSDVSSPTQSQRYTRNSVLASDKSRRSSRYWVHSSDTLIHIQRIIP